MRSKTFYLIHSISNQAIQANCPGGCPCDSTFCEEDSGDITTTSMSTTNSTVPTTTTASSSIEAALVLSSWPNEPMIVDFDGN